MKYIFRTITLLFLFLFISSSLNAQISFKHAYYIDNSGLKHDGLILDEDWMTNPTSFKFKADSLSPSKSISIDEAIEFGVSSTFKFIKRKIKIDNSSNLDNKLDQLREPVFEKKTVFLKVVLEGKYSLYHYYEGLKHNYYYSIDDQSIEPLVFKRYKFKDSKPPYTARILSNNLYIQAIMSFDNCGVVDKIGYKNIRYRKSDLKSIFKKLNKCNGIDFIEYNKKRSRKNSAVNLKIKSKLNYFKFNNVSLGYFDNYNNLNFDDKVNYGIGLELEVFLPFRNNTWSIVLEPSYKPYHNKLNYSRQIFTNTIKTTVEINYNSVELPVGIRRTYYFGDKTQLYITPQIIADFTPKSEIIISERKKPYNIDSKINFGLSIGCKIGTNFCFEVYTQSKRDLLAYDTYAKTDISISGVALTYRVF